MATPDNLFKQIGEYIAAKTGHTIGTDLFAGWFDDNAPDVCSVLQESPSTPIVFGGVGNTDRIDFEMQIISRGSSYFKAREEAYRTYVLFSHGKGILFPIGSPEYIMLTTTAVNAPYYIGKNEKGLWEFSANYTLRIAAY